MSREVPNRPTGGRPVELLECRRLLSAGDLDPTYGAGGIAHIPLALPGIPTSVDVYATDTRHGKTVVAGYFSIPGTEVDQTTPFLARVDDAGRIDKTFGGGDGKLLGEADGLIGVGDVLIQPDDKILVLTGQGLRRLKPNGSLDKAVPLPFAAGFLDAMPDGRVVVGGESARGFTAARLLPDLRFDPTFGKGGVASTDLPAADGMAVLTDGKIAVSATIGYAGSITAVQVAKLTTAGAVDRTFGEGGTVVWDLSQDDDFAGALGAAPGGKVIASGTDENGYVHLERLNPNGTVDQEFESVLGVPYSEGTPHVKDVRVSPDGRKVAYFARARFDFPEVQPGSLVAHYDADGTLDHTFGHGTGYVRTDGADVGGLQADLKLIAAGGVGDEAQVRRLQWASAPSDAISLSPDGTLAVEGTAGADKIAVSALRAANGRPDRVRVTLNNLSKTFNRSRVKAILVEASDGNDAVNADAYGIPATLEGGKGNDTLTGGGGGDQIYGGDGDDTLKGAGGDDIIDGGAGNDTLFGGAGNDALDGDAGNDTLDGGAGADMMFGEDGVDTVTYASRTKPVFVTLSDTSTDDPPNDGEAGEKDWVDMDIEVVIGGAGNDTLKASPSADPAYPVRLYGGPGDDLLVGGAGDDTLDGGPGKDRLYGMAGNDMLLGRDGFADYLDGGTGTDAAQKDALDALFGVEKLL